MPTLSKPIKRSIPSTVWEGPESNGPNGGITQSLLSRWLCCRERARLLLVNGLAPADMFNHRLEYGQMWHVCEEELADSSAFTGAPLKNYCYNLCKQYPTQQSQIQHWYNVCKVQFPIYVKYWSKHPDVKQRTPLLQERVFCVPYSLPSKRIVYLRGKWDSVDLIGKGKTASVFLQENKTKGDIVEQQMKRQLQFDLQTMVYLTALQSSKSLIDEAIGHRGDWRWGGVRYNVIRRPLSGGKGSIRQHQPTKSNPNGESDESFYQRVAETIEAEPDYFFMRWKVEVTQHDLNQFQRRFLTPCLEQLCDWWEWITTHLEDPFDGEANTIHWQTPYGFYNTLAEGGSTELDEYLASGSKLGLQKATELFGELK